jgi:NADH-quinone oxidoreductase subunit E
MSLSERVGRYVISVCTSSLCVCLGADELLEHAQQRLGVPLGGTTVDGLFTIKGSDCLAACGNAPCVMVNERLVGDVGTVHFDDLVSRLAADDGDSEVIWPCSALQH